jgi:tetratricopeptide (TPR) repeat protein
MTSTFSIPWEQIHWESFERLTYEYFRRKFGEYRYTVIERTGRGRDGGRDIEIQVEHPLLLSKIWVECKHHKNPLGLEKIGKYLVVIIVNGVQQLYLFSTSHITDAAKESFSLATARNNLKVFYLDGECLSRAVLEFPDLVNEYFPNIKETIKHKNIDHNSESAMLEARFLTSSSEINQVYSDPSYYPSEKTFVLSLLIKNSSLEPFNIESIIPHVKEDTRSAIAINIDPSTAQIPCNLMPLESIIVRFICVIVRWHGRIDNISVKIEYSITANRIVKELHFPCIDLRKYRPKPPLVGQQAIEFKESILPGIINMLNAGYPQLIVIRGSSGVGKSRLIEECRNKTISESILYLEYDASILREEIIFRRLLCDLLCLPLLHGQLSYTSAQFEELLVSRGCNPRFASDLSDFLSKSAYIADVYYSLVETIKNALQYLSEGSPISISVDNIQNLSPASLELIEEIINFCIDSAISVQFTIVVNDERTPPENYNAVEEVLKHFAERIHKSRSLGSFLLLDPLSFRSARLLVSQLIPAAKNSDALVEAILSRSGTRPFDIEMVICLLEDLGALDWSGDSYWNIPDVTLFSTTIREVPRKISDIVKSRLVTVAKALDSTFSGQASKVFRLVSAFGGEFPMSSQPSEKVDLDVVTNLLNRNLLKQDKSGSLIVPYHDNIKHVLLEVQQFSPTKDEAIRVLKILNSGDDIQASAWKIAVVRNMIAAGVDPNEVAREAAKTLHSSGLGRYSLDAIESARRAVHYAARFTNEHISRLEVIKLRISLASALVNQANVSKGLSQFKRLRKLIKNESVPKKLKSTFYHRIVNAHLHTQNYGIAVDLLKEHESVGAYDEEADFIICDRFGVAYTAQGNYDLASHYLDIALTKAKMMLRPDILFIVYYDLGYLQVHVTYNRRRAVQYFEKAVSAIKDAYDLPLFRELEGIQARGFVSLLSGDAKGSMKSIERGMWLARRNHQVYFGLKLLMLRSAAELVLGLLDQAVQTLDEARARAAHYGNERGYWRATSNLACAHWLKGNREVAKEYFIEALSKIEKKSEHGLSEETPIAANVINSLVQGGHYEKSASILEDWRYDRLKEHAAHCSDCVMRGIEPDKYQGIIGRSGFAFLIS